jgi:transposase InsO family protein
MPTTIQLPLDIRLATREEMRQTVFEYIEVDYNRTRRHSANGFISPEAFEAQRVA